MLPFIFQKKIMENGALFKLFVFKLVKVDHLCGELVLLSPVISCLADIKNGLFLNYVSWNSEHFFRAGVH